ncbi:c-type cytochrome domain-containing protein [uncultured Kriegella sp.]|uniref:c-type cytochrome domain-containing protein n=1 Tax=uncultured Kriegella sp. TaxID=1798910 RepID=UPI0030D8747B|tara:strand:- start:79325 stop:81436 length:2112 start_codon:yes stop_codon:yes gene_type:complete
MKRPIPVFLNLLFFLHIFLAFLVVFESYLEIPFWLQPVGRMHPLLLHFPVAFIALLVLLNLFKKQIEPTSFEKINYFLLLLTSLTTVLATIMGLLLSLEGYESELMSLHKWIGIAISFIIYTLVLVYQSKKVYQILLYTGFIGVIFGGHFGAGLTHGSHFLMEPITAATKKQVDENTPVYTAYVQPILEAKCTSCHNPQKHKGDLDLTSIETIAKGGENGEVWLAHNPKESLLLQRIALPLEDEEHMPPEGKTQLTEQEIELLDSWIGHGADTKISYALLKQEDSLKQLLTEKWLKDDSGKETYTFDFARAALIEELNNPYRTVVQKSPSSPAIEVAIYGRSAYKTEFLTDLVKIKEQVVYLNLANLPIDNKALEFIGELKNLEHLVLNFTEIGNDALAALVANTKLQSLSLAGTTIDIAALRYFKNMKSLKELFVWNTEVTNDDIAALNKALPRVAINEGYIPNPEEKLSLTPPTLVGEKNIISSGDRILLGHKMNGVLIRYTVDGTDPTQESSLYESGIVLDLEGKRAKTIKAIAYKDEWSPSEVSSFVFYDKGLVPDALEVVHPGILSSYTGEAAKILSDDVKNNANTYYYSKFWASFNIKPLIAIADFSASNEKIKEVVLSCGIRGNQKKSPLDFVAVWGSDDKENWKLLKRTNFSNEKDLDKIREVSLKFPEVSYKYFKIMGQPKKDNTIRSNQLFFF